MFQNVNSFSMLIVSFFPKDILTLLSFEGEGVQKKDSGAGLCFSMIFILSSIST